MNTETTILPPVPQWWWDYGLKEALEKTKREAIAFDEAISKSISKQDF